MNSFKWVECQLKALRKCRNIRAVKIALTQLPKTLDETYERILGSIDEDDQKMAHCVLQLLAVSERPLSLSEVVAAITVDCENKVIDTDQQLLKPLDILDICSSLVEDPRSVCFLLYILIC
jgi:predicted transcriptional regulator